MPYILSRCSSVERWSLQLPELQLYQLGMPELEVLELELAELEWRLAGGTLSADEEEAIRRRLAAIEQERQQCDELEKQQRDAERTSYTPTADGRLGSSEILMDHSITSQFSAGSPCEFEDETRMFVNFLHGRHTLRPVSPLRPRSRVAEEAGTGMSGTICLAREMDDILEKWKRMRTTVQHGAYVALAPVHLECALACLLLGRAVFPPD